MASEIMVAAIDFGTTYSGWAYSFQHDYKKDPTVVSIKNWSSGRLVSEKAPTTVLIHPDGRTFKAFGYEAEDTYTQLAEEGKHKKWYYFRRFKMLLMDKIGLKRSITIEDETGKELPAKTVFSVAIKYMRDDLLKDCSVRISGVVRPEEIMWVLTVPAIWNDSAKQFMREAAIEAGIHTDKLKIALEPEAASLFCRHLPIERMAGKFNISSMAEASKYMVLDAGGGTVDITVHKVLKGEKLQEVYKASGGAWGGTSVDEAFKQFLISIVGNPVFQLFVNDHMEDYMYMTHEFENKKRNIHPKIPEEMGTDDTNPNNEHQEENKVTIRLPVALKDIFHEETGETLEEALKQMKFSEKVEILKDKIRIDAEIMRTFFDNATCSIVEHVKLLFTNSAMEDVTEILMVGGFSDSKILQNSIRINFPEKKIVVPRDAGTVVLKGAVIFGHSPSAISERIAKYTYGISVIDNFIEGKHDERYKIVRGDGLVKCNNLFSTLVNIGQSLKCNESFEQEYDAPHTKATSAKSQFFATVNKNPKYVTDVGCFKIGEMRVDIDTSVPYVDRSFILSLSFGDTEIHAKALEKSTGRETTCSLNFLE